DRVELERRARNAEGLQDVIVRGIDLAGVDLAGAWLRGVRFFRCALDGARLGARLQNVLFAGCAMRGASFEGARLASGVLRFEPDGDVPTDLTEARLTGAAFE